MGNKRVNYVIDEKLVDRLKAYADRFGISQTSAVSILLTQSLDSADILKSMPELDYLVKGMSEINSKLDSGELVIQSVSKCKK